MGKLFGLSHRALGTPFWAGQFGGDAGRLTTRQAQRPEQVTDSLAQITTPFEDSSGVFCRFVGFNK